MDGYLQSFTHKNSSPWLRGRVPAVWRIHFALDLTSVLHFTSCSPSRTICRNIGGLPVLARVQNQCCTELFPFCDVLSYCRCTRSLAQTARRCNNPAGEMLRCRVLLLWSYLGPRVIRQIRYKIHRISSLSDRISINPRISEPSALIRPFSNDPVNHWAECGRWESHPAGMTQSFVLAIFLALFGSGTARCPACSKSRAELETMRVDAIKVHLLSKLGLSAAPNVSGHKLPKVPPLLTMLQSRELQPALPSSSSEDDYNARTEQMIVFPARGKTSSLLRQKPPRRHIKRLFRFFWRMVVLAQP